MQKELLEHLLDGEHLEFVEGIQSFYQKSLSFQDANYYAFTPALFDGWLMTSAKSLDFKLYKSYQNGVLGHDIPSYVLIKENKAYIITLNNVELRDNKAQTELVNRVKASRESREKIYYRDNVFLPYKEFLEERLSGETEDRRAAQAAFILSQDESLKKTSASFPTDVTYIGIAINNKQLAIEIGSNVEALFKQNVDRNIPLFIKTTKEKLQITSQPFKVELFNSDLAGIAELSFETDFTSNIAKITEYHSRAAGKENFPEVSIHAITIGHLLANRRKFNIIIRSNAEAGTGRLDCAIFSKSNNKGYLFEFKVGDRGADELAITALDQIDREQYSVSKNILMWIRLKKLVWH